MAQRGNRSAGSYRSRWRLVVSDYNAIKARLNNSTITEVSLYAINETTLKKWYQDNVHLGEVKLLLQGKEVPNLPMCAHTPLMPPRSDINTNQPTNPRDFNEPSEDITGQLATPLTQPLVQPHMQPSTQSLTQQPSHTTTHTATSMQPPTTHPIPQPPAQQAAPQTQSRTTQWRWKKKQLDPSSSQPLRKTYCCSTTKKPTSSEDHTQYRGARYCPERFPNLSREDWLEQQKKAAANKKNH